MARQHDSVVRRAGVISALTLLSRVLGVVRDAACAAVFGAGLTWDAFSFAFRVPNLFRRLFGEGALSAAFIPLFTERLASGDRAETQLLANRVYSALALLLSALVLLAETGLAAVLIFGSPSARWRLAIALTCVLLPYAVLICLTALLGATLNALQHFAAPAFAPVLLNAIWIITVLIIAPGLAQDDEGRAFVLAFGILAAGALQLGLQVLVLRRHGLRVHPVSRPLSRGVLDIGSAMAPVALGMAAFQFNVLLDGVIAISLASPEGATHFRLFGESVAYPMEIGANSVLYYSNRLMQMPLGVFGIALATAIFPTLSGQVARKDMDGFAGSVVRGLGLVIFIGVPAGVGLIVLREPLVRLLFQRGEFTPAMTARTATCLLAYSTGLWAYCAIHVLTRGFYSLKRNAVPAYVAGGAVAVNLGLNLALVWRLGEAGLATATAATAALQAVVLALLLAHHVPMRGMARLLSVFWKSAAASAAMAAATVAVTAALPGADSSAILPQGFRLLAAAATGAAVYFLTSLLLRSRELIDLLRSLAHRHA